MSGPPRDRVLPLLEKHGWNATAFQMLESEFQYWFDGDNACVGYVDTGRAWVAAGPPLAPLEQIAEVSARFVAAAAAAGRRAVLFGTEDRFREIAAAWPALRIGEQPTWSPSAWERILGERKSLREQLRRARVKGVRVRALDPVELSPGHPTRTALEALIARWTATRPMPPMGFLVKLEPFAFPERRRCFVAEQGTAGTIVGFLGVVPIYARRGWFFEDFVRDPEAPNGTIESLVDAGMRAAAAEAIGLVTLGLAPLAGEVAPLLRSARRFGRPLYDFDGLRAFKAKLAPERWSPVYLSYPPGASAALATLDTLEAFARGGLLRFGLRTLVRGPAIVIRLLAALLVLWTILLALPSTAVWFPSRTWQYGWVAFDIALFASLFTLARRWRQPLADLVAGAVTLDALATFGEAMLYNVPRASSLVDALVIATAVLAPTCASVLLWNARHHRA